MPGIPGFSGQKVLGPNRSVSDEFPDTHDDPMWKQSSFPIPAAWFLPVPVRAQTDESFGWDSNPMGPPVTVPPVYIDALVWQPPDYVWLTSEAEVFDVRTGYEENP